MDETKLATPKTKLDKKTKGANRLFTATDRPPTLTKGTHMVCVTDRSTRSKMFKLSREIQWHTPCGPKHARALTSSVPGKSQQQRMHHDSHVYA